MKTHRNGWRLFCLFALVSLLTGRAQAADVETWRGEMELPGMKLGVIVRFTLTDESAEGPITATIDIPAQGALGLPLQNVVYTDDELKFSIAQAGADFVLKRNGDTAEGDLKQAGMTFPVTLKKLTAEEAESTQAKRPQTPKPPFPYAQEEVTFENPADGTELAGTLVIPEGDGPFPAVIFITGSGPQDRDETIFGHKPFFVIADHLARNGIASLRYDDRGVGGSAGNVMDSTGFDFARDVMAAFELLSNRAEINGEQIGLFGHSEGGIIAPIVAAEHSQVAFIVLLAGTGLPGLEVLKDQMRALLVNAGVEGDALDRHLAAQEAALRSVMDGESPAEVRRAVEDLLLLQQGLERDENGSIPDALRENVNMQIDALTSNWFRSFLALDPREYLRSVKQPVLALNGSLDFQVNADLNLPEIERALEEAGNPDFTVRELDGLNHLFQTATTGMLDEYMVIEETINPRVLEIITTWITERTLPAAPQPDLGP